MMRKLLGVTALLTLLVVYGPTAADQGERTDNAETTLVGQLHGTWIAVSMEHNGQKELAPKDRDLIFTFEATKVIITEGKHTEEAPYKIAPSKTPMEIDLLPADNQKGGRPMILAIYRVDGDTMKLAFTRGGARPANFDGKEMDGGVITFKRKK